MFYNVSELLTSFSKYNHTSPYFSDIIIRLSFYTFQYAILGETFVQKCFNRLTAPVQYLLFLFITTLGQVPC